MLLSILLLATTSCDSSHDYAWDKSTFSSYSPSVEQNILLTVANNERSQLFEIVPASPPRERLVASFNGRYETIFGPLKTNGFYLAVTTKDSLGSSRLMLMSEDGQPRRVITEVGASLYYIAYLPETSQLLQLQEPEEPPCCDHMPPYFFNLYNIVESDDNIEVKRVAQVELPRIPTRVHSKFKICKGRPIFGAMQFNIYPFVGEIVANEIRVVTPEFVPEQHSGSLEETSPARLEYDLLPEKEWVVYAATFDAMPGETSCEVRIQIRNWRTNEIVGQTSTAVFGPTHNMPVAFISESKIAVATGKEFIILTRNSIEETWEREKSIPISFDRYPYPTDIKILDEHSAVVISSVVPDIPSKYRVVNF